MLVSVPVTELLGQRTPTWECARRRERVASFLPSRSGKTIQQTVARVEEVSACCPGTRHNKSGTLRDRPFEFELRAVAIEGVGRREGEAWEKMARKRGPVSYHVGRRSISPCAARAGRETAAARSWRWLCAQSAMCEGTPRDRTWLLDDRRIDGLDYILPRTDSQARVITQIDRRDGMEQRAQRGLVNEHGDPRRLVGIDIHAADHLYRHISKSRLYTNPPQTPPFYPTPTACPRES